MCKKLVKNDSIQISVTLSAAERYEMTETAKNEVFAIISSMKHCWGYERWAQLTSMVRCGRYEAMRDVIASCNNSLSKKLMLEYLDDIKALEGGDN